AAQVRRDLCLHFLLFPARVTPATYPLSLHDALPISAFPGLDPWACGVGIFGRQCRADTPLADGDRVEIYRPLTYDPMVSRRRRAEHRRAKAAARLGRERPPGLL